MRILVIGSGGREHALAWKISQSPLCESLWIAPGNPGSAQVGQNVALDGEDLESVARFVSENQIELVVIGPEGPLVAGLADRLISDGVRVFGPRADAAQLEGSKAFSKDLMQRHRIPTAGYRVYTDLNPAVSYLEGGGRYPLVVKASGLAAGKGVVICEDFNTARTAVQAMLEEGAHGEAGSTVVIEEFLDGPEASAFAITDGRTLIPLDACQDHKALRDGGEGPNTGGMGAICPTPQVGQRLRDAVERDVLVPTIHGMNHEGRRFSGVLYAGLKLTAGGPKVLEYNVRFGDPEAQVLMMRIESDIVPLLVHCSDGTLAEAEPPTWSSKPAVTVVLASEGYPAKYRKGLPITGLDDVETGPDLQVFHAGTAEVDGKLVTAGGRVMAVTARGDTLEAARTMAYEAAEKIQFDGKTLRTDIGMQGVRSLEATS